MTTDATTPEPHRPSGSNRRPRHQDSASARAAIVGCGDISAKHFAAIDALAGAELAAVVDTNADRRAAAAAAYGVPAYADLRELLDAGWIDVIHLCTPHNTHAPLAREALARGINVLTEKPVAHTLAYAEVLAASAQAAFGEQRTQFGVCSRTATTRRSVLFGSCSNPGTYFRADPRVPMRRLYGTGLPPITPHGRGVPPRMEAVVS